MKGIPIMHNVLRKTAKRFAALTTLGLGLSVIGVGVSSAAYSASLVDYNFDETYIRAYFEDMQLGVDLAKTYHPLEVRYDKGYVVLNADEDTMRELDRFGIRYDIDTEFAAVESERIQNILDQRALTGKDVSFIPSCYRTVEQTFSSAEKVARTYPDIAEWKTIGKSWEKSKNGRRGYDMNVLVLTNKQTTGDKPKLFITSAIHAREYTTAETVTQFMEGLAADYGKDPDVTWMLDHHEVHAMLHANPDGRKKAESAVTMKRKNENSRFCGDRARNKGIDLNRNFEWLWGKGGSSSRECSDTFMGPSAGSEPETQAIMGYMDKLFKDARGPSERDKAPLDTPGMYIDVHSHGRLVLYPWGHKKDTSPNAAGHKSTAQRLAFINDHLPQIGMGLYKTTGTTSDHAYGKLGVAGYTFELGTSFHEKCGDFRRNVLPGNLKALKYALRVTRAPYMQGHGPVINDFKVTRSGSSYSISAMADDTAFSNGPADKKRGKEPLESSQNISAAEIYVGTPPWAGGTPVAVKAADGRFNAKKERLSGTFDSSLVPINKKGKKTQVFIRAKDASGKWGAVYSAFVPGTAGE